MRHYEPCPHVHYHETLDFDRPGKTLYELAFHYDGEWGNALVPLAVINGTAGPGRGLVAFAQTPSAAAELALLIARAPGLRFGGLMTYPVGRDTDAFLTAAHGLIKARGLPVERVSGGGTPLMWQAHEAPSLTEYRAGTYVYGDRYILKSGAMGRDDCAMHVLTTVVSRPTAERAIIDAGSKALSSDLLGLEGYGALLEYPEATVVALSEEHGTVDFSACAQRPEVGERVTIIPNHCCVVSNLFDTIVGARQGVVELRWPVAARGRLQ